MQMDQDHNPRNTTITTMALVEGVVAPCCNPLNLQPEQSGGRGSNPVHTSTFEAPFPLLRFRMKTEWNVSVFGLVFPLKTIENGDI